MAKLAALVLALALIIGVVLYELNHPNSQYLWVTTTELVGG